MIYEKEANMKIYVWGAGRRARKYIEEYGVDINSVVGFIDNDKNKTVYMEKEVLHPNDWLEKKEEYDLIFISLFDFFGILQQCLMMEIPIEKIAINRYYHNGPFKRNSENALYVSPVLYKEMIKTPFGYVALNESDSVDLIRKVGREPFDEEDYLSDYFRFRTFELAAKDLTDIDGAVAEVGVFKGVFSSLINSVFPDRKLYLFDTFEGFDTKEAENEVRLGRADEGFVFYHKNGSEEETMRRLVYPEKAVIRKGLFPKSLKEEDYSETFAFVSLDVDFEESTFQGLVFFYPRLSKGGMIFVHDYNTYHLSGIREAVRRYEQTVGERLTKMPLADRGGSLVILK